METPNTANERDVREDFPKLEGDVRHNLSRLTESMDMLIQAYSDERLWLQLKVEKLLGGEKA